jgi:hypothetical protein
MVRKHKRDETRVRFLGGHAARTDLLGVLAYPVACDETEEEFTRFYTSNFQRWGQNPYDFDIVSVSYGESNHGLAWWLLGKRGEVVSMNRSGQTIEQIEDAGTGPGKLGYVSSLKIINGRMYVCGYQRQIYERINGKWTHIDADVLADESVAGVSFHDIDGNAAGVLCAVGFKGEIAISNGGPWSLIDSPTNEHLEAICVDGDGKFCIAGDNATVIRGDGADVWEILCCGQRGIEALWDIEWFNGQLVVSATQGLFVVRDGGLLPFEPSVPGNPAGYKLCSRDDRLWFIGTEHIFCLENGKWVEWRDRKSVV